jgi:hypothetical protein
MLRSTIWSAILAAAPAWAASYYTTRLDDSKAVYLTAETLLESGSVGLGEPFHVGPSASPSGVYLGLGL